MTNNPTLISEIKVIPGLADHDAVTIEGDISPIVNKQKPRKIHLYKKADMIMVSKNLCKASVMKFVIAHLFPGKKMKMKMTPYHSGKPLIANCTLESTNSFHLKLLKGKICIHGYMQISED